MNDLDEFRAALHGPPETQGRPAPLGDIIHAGKRLRRRRRIVTAVVAAAALAVIGGGTGIVYQASRPVNVVPAEGLYSPAGSWGAAAETGIQQKAGQFVITFYRSAEAPETLGFRGCWAGPDGAVDADDCYVSGMEPDRTPGFHSISVPQNINGQDQPMFGYFVGPAEKITAKKDGKTITAETAVWSEDPDIVMFWFPFDQYSPSEIKSDANGKFASAPELTGWAAADEDGTKLPIGDPQPAAG